MSTNVEKEEKVLHLIGFEANGGWFLTSEESFYPDFRSLSYNGKAPEKTWVDKWIFVKEYPTSITKSVTPPKDNYRFELIDEELNTLSPEKYPLTLVKDEVIYYDDVDYNDHWKEEYKHLESLYKLVGDDHEPYDEQVKFEILNLDLNVERVEEPNTDFKYSVRSDRAWSSAVVGQINRSNIQHQVFDRLLFPPILIHTRPCRLSSKDTYKIIRSYIMDNIDNRFARVTSNYDFCFTVQKIIKITPYESKWKIMKSGKYRTITIEEKLIPCFEMTSKEESYEGYTVIEGFEAENENKLKEMIDSYLTELLKFINTPVVQCEHCNGSGYHEVNKFDMNKR